MLNGLSTHLLSHNHTNLQSFQHAAVLGNRICPASTTTTALERQNQRLDATSEPGTIQSRDRKDKLNFKHVPTLKLSEAHSKSRESRLTSDSPQSGHIQLVVAKFNRNTATP
jgi:hypothetical protein